MLGQKLPNSTGHGFIQNVSFLKKHILFYWGAIKEKGHVWIALFLLISVLLPAVKPTRQEKQKS